MTGCPGRAAGRADLSVVDGDLELDDEDAAGAEGYGGVDDGSVVKPTDVVKISSGYHR